MRQDPSEVLANMRASGVLDVMGLARKILQDDPAISGEDLLAQLEPMERDASRRLEQFEADSRPERATCVKCDQPIEKSKITGDQWVHSSEGSRGCRAATYNGERWTNPDIPRSWNATPPPAGR